MLELTHANYHNFKDFKFLFFKNTYTKPMNYNKLISHITESENQLQDKRRKLLCINNGKLIGYIFLLDLYNTVKIKSIIFKSKELKSQYFIYTINKVIAYLQSKYSNIYLDCNEDFSILNKLSLEFKVAQINILK